MGQKLVEFVDRVVGDAAEHVAEPGKRINFDEFARSDEAAEHRRRLAAIITSEERPIVASDGDAAERALGRIIRVEPE